MFQTIRNTVLIHILNRTPISVQVSSQGVIKICCKRISTTITLGLFGRTLLYISKWFDLEDFLITSKWLETMLSYKFVITFFPSHNTYALNWIFKFQLLNMGFPEFVVRSYLNKLQSIISPIFDTSKLDYVRDVYTT